MPFSSRFSSSERERDIEEGRSLLQQRRGTGSNKNKKSSSHKKSSSSSSSSAKSYRPIDSKPFGAGAAGGGADMSNLIFTVVVLIVISAAVVGLLLMLHTRMNNVANDVAHIEYLYRNITITPNYCLTPNNVDATLLAGWIF